MIHHLAERVWDARPSRLRANSLHVGSLHPGSLVDWLLDQLERMSRAMLSAQVVSISCSESEIEPGFDQFLGRSVFPLL